MGSSSADRSRSNAAGHRARRGVVLAALALSLGAATAPLAAGAVTPVRHGTHGAAARAPGNHGRLEAPRTAVVHHRLTGLRAPSLSGPAPLGRVPRLAKPHVTPTKTFTVTTAADSPLASPALKTCTDAAGGKCSLRAAVDAANNLGTPVLIKLGPHTYQVTDTTAGTIVDTDAGGTVIEGTATHATVISAQGGFTDTTLGVEENAQDLGASLTLENLTVSGGSGSEGGGIAADDANVGLVLDGVEVTHGSATEGGGVYCDSASVWATNSSISGNSALEYGGGLFLDWCATYLTHTNVNSDQSTTDTSEMYGGGIYQEYGVLNALGCSISNDTVGAATEPGVGGGLVGYYASTTLVNTNVDHDTAKGDGGGGGVYTYYSVLGATGSSFSEDRSSGASSWGGGLGLYYGSDVALHDSTVEHDATGSTSSTDAGGGLYLYGYESPVELTVDDHSSISDNKTGAILAYEEYGGADITITGSTLKGNTNSLEGSGGIYAYSYYGGGTLTLNGDTLVGNGDAAEDSSGAVYAYDEYGSESITMNGTMVKGNLGAGKDSMGGVGLYPYYGSIELHATGSSFLDNRAPVNGWGGGLGVYDEEDSNALLALTGCKIEGNVSGSSNSTDAGDGGGIYIYDYGYLHLVDSLVEHNSALGGGSSSGYGGGIFNESYLGETYQGDTISSNKATGASSEGGGIWDYPYYGGSRMVQSTLSDNTAEAGAGLYLYYYQFNLDQSTVVGNVAGSAGAEGLGGGIFAYDTRLVVENSTVTANRAVTGAGMAGEGGGIFDDDGGVSLYYATVSGNVAPAGAGIYTSDGYGTLRDSIIAGNHPSMASKGEADCKGNLHKYVLTSIGGNVIAQGGCVATRTSTDTVTTKAGLLALAANGGPTKTMALTASSPAVNAAHGDCLSTDQRGMPRPSKGLCDAGAFQLVAKASGHKH